MPSDFAFEPVIAGRWLLVLWITLGHGAWWLACFNRINATGLHRKTIKVIEKFFVAACFLMPILFLANDGGQTAAWLSLSSNLLAPHWAWQLYWLSMGLALFFLAPAWLLGRIHLTKRPSCLVSLDSDRWDLRSELPIFRTRKAQWLGSWKWNEIGAVEFSVKRLRCKATHAAWKGLRIGHISDLHLTGSMDESYYRFAFEKLLQCKPDLLVLSGDVVDCDSQLEKLGSILSCLDAQLGKYYVLGNHDRMVSRPDSIREHLELQGWIGVGGTQITVAVDSRKLRIAGNERPWFDRSKELNRTLRNADVDADGDAQTVDELRLAISHSPDQWRWAAQWNAHLLLAGHTHGGQVRLPGIGPIVAPSWFGSRFASGVFEMDEMVMHVSRGLSGVHLLRWRCPPEISLLVLE